MKKVLIVEDDDAIRCTLTMLLADAGYLVSTAANGEEGLDYLRQESREPCLVLLDLLMPKMDGQEFIKALKKDDKMAQIPVVAFTAVPNQTKVDGTLGIIKKPVNLDALFTLIESVCGDNEQIAV